MAFLHDDAIFVVIFFPFRFIFFSTSSFALLQKPFQSSHKYFKQYCADSPQRRVDNCKRMNGTGRAEHKYHPPPEEHPPPVCINFF